MKAMVIVNSIKRDLEKTDEEKLLAKGEQELEPWMVSRL